MDEIVDPNTSQPEPTVTPTQPTEEELDAEILKLAKERFKQSYEAHREDFEACKGVQAFISGDQWPAGIKSDRESQDRPCLTLDHLNQYVRHVVNSGLKQSKDVRVLAMSGDADDKVGEILAGMVRQITQTSTSKVAYETGLRHECQIGFGYWRCKVQEIPKTKTQTNPEGLMEITIRKIKDPRMVLMDPFCEYPDGRDSHYCFVLTKLTTTEFKTQYPAGAEAGAKSWHDMDDTQVLPWIGQGNTVVAEYYYLDPVDQTMKWAILCPDMVLNKGIHHGDVMPIIRTVGEEFEVDGKERKRGMINGSSMDAQRAYNYSSSAFIEAVALAPLAPFIAEEGQIEQHITEWKDAHRVPRAVLRYKSVSVGGQLAPPPQRSQPAGIPAGWQGMMTNLISDTQMIMGLAQPSVLGTGGAPVQSGAGIEAQQAPGEINTFHFHEHWHIAIEQTGRVILAMIPHVYTKPQVVKIVGEDGRMETAMLNPGQQTPMVNNIDQALNKVTSVSYNPSIGRYDVAISTGPSSASKKSEANRTLTALVTASPELMKVAGDLLVESIDMAGADRLAKRLKSMLPPGIDVDEDGKLAMIQKTMAENEQLKQEMSDMEKIIMAEREKSQAKLMETRMDNQAAIQEQQLNSRADLFRQRVDDQAAIQMATIKSQTDLEISSQGNIVKLMIAKIAAQSKIDVEIVRAFTSASQEPTHESRMSGYLGVMGSLAGGGDEPAGELVPLPAASPTSAAMMAN
jgi:hypothetical protein